MNTVKESEASWTKGNWSMCWTSASFSLFSCCHYLKLSADDLPSSSSVSQPTAALVSLTAAYSSCTTDSDLFKLFLKMKPLEGSESDQCSTDNTSNLSVTPGSDERVKYKSKLH